MKKIITAVALLASSLFVSADISWFHNIAEGNPILDQLSTPLTGSRTDSAVGTFVQLIYDSAGDGIDPATALTTTGASDDDQVVAVSWMGRFIFGSNDGFVAATPTAFTADIDAGQYYVRFWNQPATFFDEGNPQNSTPLKDITSWYGNSIVFTNPTDPNGEPPNQPSTFEFAPASQGTFQTDTQLIPEPGVAMLMVLGLGGIGFFRRKLRSV